MAPQVAKTKKETVDKKVIQSTKTPNNSKKPTPAAGKGTLFGYMASNNLSKLQTKAPEED